MRFTTIAFVMFGVAGCAPVDTAPRPTKTDPIPFQLDAQGVQLVGRSGRIDFGRTDHSAELAMNKLVGEGPASRAICGDGTASVTWPDGTVMYFRGGDFRGWSRTAADSSSRQGGRTCA